MWPFKKKAPDPPPEPEFQVVLPKPKQIEKLFQDKLYQLEESLSDELSYRINREYDDISDEDWGKLNFISDEVIKLHKALCGKYGHYVIDDHCGRPEHRHCFYCRESTPNEEVS
jgi:hypothetical protein